MRTQKETRGRRSIFDILTFFATANAEAEHIPFFVSRYFFFFAWWMDGWTWSQGVTNEIRFGRFPSHAAPWRFEIRSFSWKIREREKIIHFECYSTSKHFTNSPSIYKQEEKEKDPVRRLSLDTQPKIQVGPQSWTPKKRKANALFNNGDKKGLSDRFPDAHKK